MLNPIARRLLMAHYDEIFQPLTEPEFAERDTDGHPCAGLMVVRMLTRTPDGRMMQALATIGASQHSLPREEGGGENRNEYVMFVPADWNLEEERNRGDHNLLADGYITIVPHMVNNTDLNEVERLGQIWKI